MLAKSMSVNVRKEELISDDVISNTYLFTVAGVESTIIRGALRTVCHG